MTEKPFSSGHSDIQSAIIAFPNRKITWAGEGVADDTFLFGTSTGFILESGISAPLNNTWPFRAVREMESINDAAFFLKDDELHLGVSTRSKIAIHCFPSLGANPQSYPCDFGGHSIKITLNKNFISPA